jgi:hypothetical protein
MSLRRAAGASGVAAVLLLAGDGEEARGQKKKRQYERMFHTSPRSWDAGL